MENFVYSWLFSILLLDKIKVLIDAAAKEGVTFVYAISPGLDISFASAADVAALKRKMKQVKIPEYCVVNLVRVFFLREPELIKLLSDINLLAFQTKS